MSNIPDELHIKFKETIILIAEIIVGVLIITLLGALTL